MVLRFANTEMVLPAGRAVDLVGRRRGDVEIFDAATRLDLQVLGTLVVGALEGRRSVVLRASTEVTPLTSVIVSAPGRAAPFASVNGTQVYAPVAFGVRRPNAQHERLARSEVVSRPDLTSPELAAGVYL